MHDGIRRSALFRASCIALLVTSLSFGIRAGILARLGVEFALDVSQLATIAATAFWGFPLAIVAGGFIVDVIGMKALLVMAFLFHLLGILLTIFAGGFWSLFFSTLLVGIANGTVEAACNALVTALYPGDKTTKLNHFHLWFPGGIVIGTLVVLLFDRLGLGWQAEVGVMAAPTLVYGYLFYRLRFPVTERVAAGVSTSEMYRAVVSPLFLFLFVCMFGTAITELFTGQWIDVLLRGATSNALLVLTITTGVMVVGRAFAGPVVHRLAPQGVLLVSAILASAGLYLLAHADADTVFAGALVFGLGVCYFWPTMLGLVAEYIPRSGALGLNLLGGAGMFAVSVYTMFMGWKYDALLASHLPAGGDLASYREAAPGTALETQLLDAQRSAGPEVLQLTLVIPVVLVVAFAGLCLYLRGRPACALAPADAGGTAPVAVAPRS